LKSLLHFFYLKGSPSPFQGADWEPPEQDPWAILSRRASLLLRATFALRASLSARAAFAPQATFLTGATFAPRALSARAAFELLLDSCSFLHRSRLCTGSHVLHGSHLCSKSLLPCQGVYFLCQGSDQSAITTGTGKPNAAKSPMTKRNVVSCMKKNK
jgi:hypothetical protein